jgi:hypothetical protein
MVVRGKRGDDCGSVRINGGNPMKKFELIGNLVFAILFAMIGLTCLVGAAFIGACWCFYEFLLSAGLAYVFTVARDDSGDSVWKRIIQQIKDADENVHLWEEYKKEVSDRLEEVSRDKTTDGNLKSEDNIMGKKDNLQRLKESIQYLLDADTEYFAEAANHLLLEYRLDIIASAKEIVAESLDNVTS